MSAWGAMTREADTGEEKQESQGRESSRVLHIHAAREKAFTSYIGMLIFLASWAMMFAALFYTYASLRSRMVSWPPDGLPDLPVVLPGVNTAVILASSLALHLSLRSLKRDDGRFLKWLWTSIGLGVLFLVLQVVLWGSLWQQGLKWSSGAFGSVFYAFTAFHALHVVVGLGILVLLVPRAKRGEFTPRKHIGVKISGMFWHFVDAVWITMYVTLFLI